MVACVPIAEGICAGSDVQWPLPKASTAGGRAGPTIARVLVVGISIGAQGSVNSLSSTLQLGVDGASEPQGIRDRTEHQPRPPGDVRRRFIRRSRRCSASPR
ncbi:conserved hypothetical protein [Xanthomonas citri pv. citri]|nr:conserved hypothetical protein [Xanthomonas citri pv. citri]CEE39373.1 conserved hypothetical protein [Xanthomonas citri pv. citri]CEE47048.1 conserved hypothetical protein [Xanthomonas citri pv. citri]CEE76092.1 conserved hypothetical protein [Xanthomonas citri pv. citri]CEE80464.1 conserved hypothetical protein [Xanthomonas citri pv. citri]